ncbi:MAG: DUF721 domain-containing protein [Lysobacteraceae bacterium]|nr:MAG: DUF721 domain-containing protein [Xanthomonadaceae bacterium]
MPGSRSKPPGDSAPPSGPRAALDALLVGSAGGTLRRAQWLDALDQLLRPYLPPAMAAHARLANVRGDKLVFVVDAPVWHAKLRLATQELVDAARSIGLEVTGVSARTTTQPLRPASPAATRTPMSAATQSGLEAALALLRSDAPGEGTGGDR